ncbi:MAG: hypothetical protein ACRCXQ_14895 [Vagococcus fluvialis]
MFIVISFCYLNNWLISASLLTIITTVTVMIKNKQKIRDNIVHFFREQKNIKQLTYFYFKDTSKVIDKKKRLANIESLKDFGAFGYILGIMNFAAISFILTKLFGNYQIIRVIMSTTLTFFLVFIMMGIIFFLTFKYTTMVYCCIPFVSLLVFFSFYETIFIIQSWPTVLLLCVFLIIHIILCISFTYFLPIHILRQINSRAVIISAFITLATSLLLQSSAILVDVMLRDTPYFVTPEMIEQDSAISQTLKTLLIEDGLLDVFNYFSQKELTAYVSGVMSVIVSGATLSVLIANFCTSFRLNKAKKMFYNLILENNTIEEYKTLQEIAYLGGSEIEYLIISNDSYLEVIREEEAWLIEVPKLSFIKDQIKRLKRLI